MNRVLPIPAICECGFSTMDAHKANQHIIEKHPDMIPGHCDFCAHLTNCEIAGDIVTWCKAFAIS